MARCEEGIARCEEGIARPFSGFSASFCMEVLGKQLKLVITSFPF